MLKVYKVADIVDGEVLLCGPNQGPRRADILAFLTNLKAAANPRSATNWQIEMTIGVGSSKRMVRLDLPPVLSVNDSMETPLFLGDGRVVFYRDQLFAPQRPPKTTAEREEIILRIRKFVYDEQAELASLKAAVANLDAALEYTKSGPQRQPIPEDVKLLVWARDGGACVRCGSKAGLHFDHIIPVAKGGGNSEANIQILCEPCNLRKADKIATPLKSRE